MILLFGISISIICYNDGKSCIPLNFHYFNIKWLFWFFPVTVLAQKILHIFLKQKSIKHTVSNQLKITQGDQIFEKLNSPSFP